MAPSRTRYVGLEVQKASSAVAYGAQEYGAAVISLGPVGTRPWESDKRSRPLQAKRKHLVLV